MTASPTKSAAAASGLEKKGFTSARSLRRIVVAAVPSCNCPMNRPMCVREPSAWSTRPKIPVATTATTATPIHCFQPILPPASAVPSAISAATSVSAPPTSAPSWGRPSTISAGTPTIATPTTAAVRRSRHVACASTTGPVHAAAATTSAAAASAKAVFDMP